MVGINSSFYPFIGEVLRPHMPAITYLGSSDKAIKTIDRKKKVYKAVLKYVKAKKDAAVIDDLYPGALPYIESLEKWFINTEGVLEADKSFYSKAYGFKGKVDLITRFKGESQYLLVQLKLSSNIQKIWRTSLGGLSVLAKENGFEIGRAGILRLTAKDKPPLFTDYSQNLLYDEAGYLNTLLSYKYFQELERR